MNVLSELAENELNQFDHLAWKNNGNVMETLQISTYLATYKAPWSSHSLR